jgi:hypothetical protein
MGVWISAVHFKEEGMRAIVACFLALGLIALPELARAGGTGDGDKDGAAASRDASSAPTQPASSPATTSANAPAATAEASSMASEIRELRELLDSQAKQLQEQQQQMQMLEEKLDAESSARENLASSPAIPDPNAVGPTPSVVSGSLASGEPRQEKNPDEPLSIHFKGITLTPGGFMAAETVWRSKALASDVNTPFNSAPFSGTSQANTSEFQASGRQSRISMLAEGKLDDVKIGGYYEMDFLSAGTTSNPNESNSYTARVRQFWGQAAFNSGWTVTAGQMWSLLTETTKGMDNRSEALPQTIDANYNVGFTWARQYAFRVTKSFNNKIWLGFAVEEPQATLTVHGNPTATCAPANPQVTGSLATCSAGALNGTLVVTPTETGGLPTTGTAVIGPTVFNNFLVGSFGASGGLYNPLGNYAYNPAPDLVFKADFEPGFGHYEIFGVLTRFRDRVFPCVTVKTDPGCGGLAVSAADAFNNSATGGGAGANARVSLFAKKMDVGIHFMAGDGIGRYGPGGLPDLTTRYVPTNPGVDGTLSLIRGGQALGTLQFHPTPKLDINLYVGGEYAARTAYAKTAGGIPNEGYGAIGFNNYGCTTEILPFAAQSTSASTGVPTGVAGSNGFIPGVPQNCTGDTRNLIEGTISFWYRFYKGSKGTVQFGGQYSNFVRNTWTGVPTGTVNGITYSTNGGPHVDENMVLTSFRYVLP